MKTFGVRLFRAAAVIVAAWLIGQSYRATSPANDAGMSLADARQIFTSAARIGPPDPIRQSYPVFDAAGESLGAVLKTAPETDDLIGYSGPSNLLVGIGPSGEIQGVRLIASQDTPPHVDDIRRTATFWDAFRGWSPAADKPPPIEAVSGSTLTSLALAEGVQQRLTGGHLSLRFPDPITLEEVGGVFPAASKLLADDPRPSWMRVVDTAEQTLGYVLRTSPQSDNLIGYKGPTESLLAIAADRQTIVAVKLRRSYDTEEYVERVREDEAYLAAPVGKSLAEWAKVDFREEGIEGVSGATQTSFAVLEGARRRAAAEFLPPRPVAEGDERWRRDLGVFTVLAGGLAMCFTRLRGNSLARAIWRWCLILMLGLWFGDLVSLALFAGWSRHGVPWHSAPGLTALVAVTLLTPWTTKRQIYCHHLCPHGAAQEVLGRFKSLHRPLPAPVSRALSAIPYALLALAVLLAIANATFDLSQLEPFDAWVLRRGAIVSSIIAAVGLVASLFVPQAYCRFGCPTGALLKLIRSHGAADAFGRRELFSAALLAVGGLLVAIRSLPTSPAAEQPATVLRGEAFGTTWSVKFRRPLNDPIAVRERIARELERIEAALSSWRPTSETSQFNAGETTLALEFSPEFVKLVAEGQKLSQATNGAFDLTVAPLVDAWGFGPAGKKSTPPTDDELAAILPRVGWEKLSVDVETNTLQKKVPDLQLDLGALLQGYAAERVAELLDEDALIEVGGELRARGAWRVAIENPKNPHQPLRTFELKDAALATSGVYRRGPNGEMRTRHIVSPKTGKPVTTRRELVAVIRPSAFEADGWATALLAADDPAAVAAEYHVAALWLTDDGNVKVSAAGENRFVVEGEQ